MDALLARHAFCFAHGSDAEIMVRSITRRLSEENESMNTRRTKTQEQLGERLSDQALLRAAGGAAGKPQHGMHLHRAVTNVRPARATSDEGLYLHLGAA